MRGLESRYFRRSIPLRLDQLFRRDRRPEPIHPVRGHAKGPIQEPIEQQVEKEEEEVEHLDRLESKSTISSPEPASPPTPAEEKENPLEEDYLDNIELIMKEAKQIRQASQTGEMTDEERRQRAGNAATMLMGLLDQMGFDDEDSSSDEE